MKLLSVTFLHIVTTFHLKRHKTTWLCLIYTYRSCNVPIQEVNLIQVLLLSRTVAYCILASWRCQCVGLQENNGCDHLLHENSSNQELRLFLIVSFRFFILFDSQCPTFTGGPVQLWRGRFF